MLRFLVERVRFLRVRVEFVLSLLVVGFLVEHVHFQCVPVRFFAVVLLLVEYIRFLGFPFVVVLRFLVEHDRFLRVHVEFVLSLLVAVFLVEYVHFQCVLGLLFAVVLQLLVEHVRFLRVRDFSLVRFFADFLVESLAQNFLELYLRQPAQPQPQKEEWQIRLPQHYQVLTELQG